MKKLLLYWHCRTINMLLTLFKLMVRNLGEHFGFSKWPKDVIKTYKMLALLLLHFTWVSWKRSFITRYWSIDSTTATPFTRTVISRNEFENIFAFLHFCDNSEYATKGQPGYNPKKKLGFTHEKLVENFHNIWLPCKIIAIDKGTVPFKGSVHFKCYDINKRDKYGMKTFKVCDSSNAFCCVLDIYVGETDDGTKASKFGKTHDLIIKGCVIHVDNFYSSSYLFYNLLSLITHACGTVPPVGNSSSKIQSLQWEYNYELWQ